MKISTWIGRATAILLIALVGLTALRYLVPGAPPGPDFIMQNAMAYPWLFVHAGFGAAALLLGPLQFASTLRSRAPRVHRWMGRAYLISALAGGLAGLVLAVGATAGPIASAGFGALALMSLLCAAQAWRLAMARRFDEHRRWVIRSYALIFAAVTLRIWLPLSGFVPLDPMDSYRVISFLCWVPNLLLAELYLARGRATKGRSGLQFPSVERASSFTAAP